MIFLKREEGNEAQEAKIDQILSPQTAGEFKKKLLFHVDKKS